MANQELPRAIGRHTCRETLANVITYMQEFLLMVKHVVRDEDLWYGHIRDCVTRVFNRVAGKV